PYAVLAFPLATATLPRLAERAAQDDRAGFAHLSAVTTRSVLVVAAVAAWTFLSVPVWRAAAIIRVEEQGGSDIPVLDVLSGLQQGSEIETELRIVRTRPILEEVADDLDLNFVVESPRGSVRRLLFAAHDFGRDTPEMTFHLKRLGAGRWEVASTGEWEGRVRAAFAPGEKVALPGGSFILADLEGAAPVEGFEFPDEIHVRTLG
ncbi:MAG: Wzz/FepE/Etk N-terminal domain-containing protein, partial [Longimicrobiales bacterium]|nr:Wzz/FepE/Etk N-terminal domain-containing protein [Longimicrobiales bacterium]